jgi:dipeptidyl aminopeptidase/acylaminoacyl peptidase
MQRTLSLIAAASCLASGAVAQTKYSLSNYLNIRGSATPTISPDGKEVAFRTAPTGTMQVWKCSTAGSYPEQLTYFSSSVLSATWSPRGDEILAVVDTDGNEQFQLHLINSKTGESRALTTDPKVRNEFGNWSQDGKYISFANNSRDSRYFDVYVMEVATKSTKRVLTMDAVMDGGGFSSDGKRLIASKSVSAEKNDLFIVDLTTGQSKPLTSESDTARYAPVSFTPDGQRLVVMTDKGKDVRNLAEIDLATGKLKYVKESPFEVEAAISTVDKRVVAYLTNEDGYSVLRAWDTATERELKLPAVPKGVITLGGFSANGESLALGINGSTTPSDVYVLNMREGSLKQVTRASKSGVDPASYVPAELIKYKSFDGRDIPAFLYLPKDRSAGKLPVILDVHGGPEAQERPLFNIIYQYLANQGFAVIAPNIRGSMGYGKSYLAMDNGHKRWDALKDLNAAIDWVGTRPELDAKKVAIIGGSYGGFAVLAMLAHYPNRFAAGVDMFGIADFKTFLANTAPYRRPLRAVEYGDPEKDSAFLDAISPARNADKIKAPLLVLQGANDPRVPESESRQIVEKVKSTGGVVEYMVFPDEGHGFAKLKNRVVAYDTLVKFLDKYLNVSSAGK